jgi:hypothetical protein
MKKIFSHIILSMKIVNHLVISMVLKIQLGTKHGIYDYMTPKWSLIIFVLIINVKFWCSENSNIYFIQLLKLYNICTTSNLA